MTRSIKINNISEGKSLNIIQKPILTEKSTNLNQYNQYSFVVNQSSNSLQIKKAIEKIFKVKVKKVNTSNVKGKLKSFRGSLGRRSNYKKAFVTLEEGQTIDINAGV